MFEYNKTEHFNNLEEYLIVVEILERQHQYMIHCAIINFIFINGIKNDHILYDEEKWSVFCIHFHSSTSPITCLHREKNMVISPFFFFSIYISWYIQYMSVLFSYGVYIPYVESSCTIEGGRIYRFTYNLPLRYIIYAGVAPCSMRSPCSSQYHRRIFLQQSWASSPTITYALCGPSIYVIIVLIRTKHPSARYHTSIIFN